MAVGTDFQMDILTDGRARLDHVAATAGSRDLFILGMDFRFHRP
jgi:hypothetical protein